MGKFDHLSLQVSNYAAARDWYRDVLGLAVEFEQPERGFGALKDDSDFAIFIGEVAGAPASTGVGLWYQVADVDAFHRERTARGVVFDHAPQKTPWGYGAQLSDPDGHKLYVWDDASMKAKG
jgi:catechol 2,3-dioxygenase-like lactoylglutathione lyase family enzyme